MTAGWIQVWSRLFDIERQGVIEIWKKIKIMK